MEFAMPEGYEQEVSKYGPGTMAFSRMSGGSSVAVRVRTISEAEAFPIGDCKLLIDAMHEALLENQGLIEVNGGVTAGGDSYIYLIVKRKPGKFTGNDYHMRFDCRNAGQIVSIDATARELGDTGARDVAICALMYKQGVYKPGDSIWSTWRRDPYDPNRTKGRLMNLSEEPQYDHIFPEHPLSQIRELVRFLIGHIE